MIKHSATQGTEERVRKVPTQRALVHQGRSRPRIQKRRGKLPPEVILEAMKWLHLQDLEKFVRTNGDFSVLASTSKEAICKDIQSRQYPEYDQLFGVVGSETALQKKSFAAEIATRQWWMHRDDEEYNRREQLYIDRLRGKRSLPAPLPTGAIRRINYFAALREEIEETTAKLREEGSPGFGPGEERATRQALILSWKLQWLHRPGLQHLASQDQATCSVLQDLSDNIAAEAPAVQLRYREIMEFIGSRIWERVEMWDFTRDWWTRNKSLILKQRYWKVEDVERVVREMTAGLVVEVILRIGVDRALRLEHADECDWDTIWINGEMTERLEKLLDDLVPVFMDGGEAPRYGFGGTIGLLPEDIADVTIGMLEEAGPMKE
ncbi:MAG: hypothetical protein Q9168_006995 [Polycauliona sp. 1 TL-2023]